MEGYKLEVLSKICYTELVYGRINKKLKLQFSREEIEAFVLEVIKQTDETGFEKFGKNIYITNKEKQVSLTINSTTYRIITADKI